MMPRSNYNPKQEMHLRASPEALICLECDLPAKNCNRNSCARYKEEKKKLKKGDKL